MIHPDTEPRFINENIGFGVVATRFIPKGTVVWVQDELDQVLAPTVVEKLPAMLRKKIRHHGYFDRDGNILLLWDHGKYTNHSCVPTCLSPGYGFELAIRDIHPGEQLTDDYATLNLECGFTCCCGASECRGDIHGVPASDLVAHWDELAAEAFARLPEVPQPLWEMLTPEDRAEVEAICQHTATPRSCGWHLLPSPVALPS